MIEVVAALSAANAAFNALKSGVEKGKELQDMAGTLASFFEANEQISEASIEAQEVSNTAKMVAGKSIEYQAMEVALAKQRAARLEKELREYLIYTGQGDFYRDMLKQRRIIKQRRLEAVRAAAKRKSDMIDIVVGIVAVGVVVVTLIGMVYFIAKVNAASDYYLDVYYGNLYLANH